LGKAMREVLADILPRATEHWCRHSFLSSVAVLVRLILLSFEALLYFIYAASRVLLAGCWCILSEARFEYCHTVLPARAI
jgi:hypothetical protein